jgi:hypothetical protein
MTDVKKAVAKRRQQLRIRIENLKIMRKTSSSRTLDFKGEQKSLTNAIVRAERELAMLEAQWKL